MKKYIAWVEDPRKFDYVRSVPCYFNSRTCFPVKEMEQFEVHGDLIVGYECLRPEVQCGLSGMFERRVYILRNYDRGQPLDEGTYEFTGPVEAIDPLTLLDGPDSGSRTSNIDLPETERNAIIRASEDRPMRGGREKS